MSKPLTLKEESKRYDVVLRYLRGEQIEQTKTTLTNLGLTKDEFKQVKVDVADNPFTPFNKQLKALFQVLNIQDERIQKDCIRQSKDLYDLLIRLRTHHDIYHLKKLIHLIDNTSKKPLLSWWAKTNLFIGSLLVGSALFDFFDAPAFQKCLDFLGKCYRKTTDWLMRTFQVAKNITLLALCYNTFLTLYRLQGVLRSPTKTPKKKLVSSLFVLSVSALTIGSYVLTYLTLGVATPLSASLMVCAEMVQGIKTFVSLRTHKHKFKNIGECPGANNIEIPYGERAAYQRTYFNFKQHQATLKTKIAVALLSTIVVAVWCFYPPSILLTTFCVGGLMILGGLQTSIVKAFKNHYQARLQKTLDEMPERADDINARLEPALRAQEERVVTEELDNGLELTHRNLRLRLPKGATLQEKHDDKGAYTAVFFKPERPSKRTSMPEVRRTLSASGIF